MANRVGLDALKMAADEGWSDYICNQNDEEAVKLGCVFSEARAQRVVSFIERFCKHSKNSVQTRAGEPFKLLPWQKNDFIAPLFGWIRPDGTRRFRRAYKQVAKKNGKSTLCAALELYMLCGDGEPSSEVYAVANDREQASIVFNESLAMGQASPELASHLVFVPSKKTIKFPRLNSVYRALSSDANTKEGFNIHFLVFDELHALKNRLLWDTLKYAFASRSQPLSLAITTAGSDKDSVCYEVYSYAKDVIADKVIDTTFFGLVYEAEEQDDYRDETTWRKANPGLGHTINIESFRADCDEAYSMGPATFNQWLRYRLDVWTSTSRRWLPLGAWNDCGDDLRPIDKRACYAGLDIGAVSDLTALTLVWPDVDGTYDVKCWVYCPDETIAAKTKEGLPYQDWVDRGLMIPTPGAITDYSFVRQHVNELGKQYNIQEIAADRLFQGNQLCTDLSSDGFIVIPFGQGFTSMSAPTKEVERLVLGKRLRHARNMALAYMADNVTPIEDPAGNVKPNKAKSKGKIDGIVALIMAVGRAMANAPPAPSVYETRGVIELG